MRGKEKVDEGRMRVREGRERAVEGRMKKKEKGLLNGGGLRGRERVPEGRFRGMVERSMRGKAWKMVEE